MHPRFKLALILAFGLNLGLGLSGCGSLLAPQQAPLTYRLNPEGSAASTKASTTFPYSLQVVAPRSGAGFDTSMIAYRQQPYRLDYYTQSRWVDHPATMLGERITHALEQSGTYRVILAPGVALPSDLRLATELVALEQVFSADTTPPSGSSKVRFVLRMQLIDSKNARVLASGRIELDHPAPSADAQGAVTAANQTLRDALPKIVQFCVENTPSKLAGS